MHSSHYKVTKWDFNHCKMGIMPNKDFFIFIKYVLERPICLQKIMIINWKQTCSEYSYWYAELHQTFSFFLWWGLCVILCSWCMCVIVWMVCVCVHVFYSPTIQYDFLFFIVEDKTWTLQFSLSKCFIHCSRLSTYFSSLLHYNAQTQCSTWLELKSE